MDRNIDKCLFVFIPERSTTEASFYNLDIYTKGLYQISLDLEKAFDRILREIAKWAM